MLYLWNNFQPKASTWMCLTSSVIMVHNKGNFEKVIGHNFFKLSLNIHTSIWFVYLQFYANHLFVVYAIRIINQQCRITFVYIHKKQWYAKQKHPGCLKMCKAKKQHCKWVHMWQKALISTKAKQLFTKTLLAAWMTIVYSVFSQLWLALSLGHLFCIIIIIKVAKWQSQS